MRLLIVWLVFSGQKRAVQRQDVSNYPAEMWATEGGRDRHSGKNSLTVTPWIFSANISTNYFTLPNMVNKQACKQTFSVWIIHHILSFNKLVDCMNLSCIRGKFDLCLMQAEKTPTSKTLKNGKFICILALNWPTKLTLLLLLQLVMLLVM